MRGAIWMLIWPAAAWAQEPPEFTDAISREFTLLNGPVPPVEIMDAVSREFTILNGPVPSVEIDDAISREFTILVRPPTLSDLAVTRVTPPTSGVLAGTAANVTFVVTNQSKDPTDVGHWMDGVFLVTEPALREDLASEPLFLGQFENPIVLAPQGAYSNTVQVHLPPRLTGTFSIAVYTDSRKGTPWLRGSIFDLMEMDEGNNWMFSAPFRIDAGDRPDLEVSDISVPDEAFYPRIFKFAWTVRNSGSAQASGRWLDAAYLSKNSNLSIEGDRPVGWVWHDGPLPATGSYTVPLEILLDERETFYVKVRTDIDDAVWEPLFGGEGNNIAVSHAVHVNVQPLCDLEPKSMSVPGNGVPGHSIEVRWTAGKTGGLSTDHPLVWKDGVYLSRDQVLDAGDLLLSKFSHGTTLDGEGKIVLPDYGMTATVLLPGEIPEGTYFLIVFVDVDGEVFEEPAEDNNWLSGSAIQVAYTSMDLAMAAPCPGEPPAPAFAAAGQTMKLSWQVRNIGRIATSVPIWRDGVYLSADGIPSGDDIPLAIEFHSSPLGPQASYCVRKSAEVPRVPPGSYFLLFIADLDNTVPEISPDEGKTGEENNIFALPFTVVETAPDLVVMDIRCAGTAESAVPFHIGWTVENRGNLGTQAGFWADRVYLSTDGQLDAGDILIGSKSRTSPLANGASYSPEIDVDLPADLSGAFRVIVRTDCDDQVFESSEANNVLVKDLLLDVELSPPPDLVVSDVAAPPAAVSGQTICVSWKVTNTGQGPTRSAKCRDSVYLARDPYFDRSRDIYLGSYERAGVLGPSESYTAQKCFDVPFGVSGPYYTFVVTDCAEMVSEPVPAPVEVALPAASELVVAEVLPASSGVVGEETRFEWQIENAGGVAIEGRWFDSVYISADESWDVDDRLLGRFEVSPDGPLAPLKAFKASGKAAVLVKPGSYRLIVRTDVYDQIPEVNEWNNVGVSERTMEVSAVPLDLGAPPKTGTLLEAKDRYFGMNVPAGETVRIVLDHGDPSAWTELYASFEDLPEPGRFEFRYSSPGLSHQSLKIPETGAGNFYVLVRGAPGNFEIQALAVPFSVDSVSPKAVGEEGRATLTVEGSRFVEGVQVRLERAGAPQIPAHHIEVKNGVELRARFLLKKPTRGLYDLVAVSPGGTVARLPGAVEIEALVPPFISIESSEPPALREGLSGGTWDWTVMNRGNVDAEYLFLLEAIEVKEGRTLLGVGPEGVFAGSAMRGGAFHLSALVRSLAPGEKASLSTTLRAGLGVGDMPVGQGIALLSTERFLRFEEEVAEAARGAVLADPAILLTDQRNSLLDTAQDPARWRSFWLSKLAEARLVDPEDLAGRDPAAALARGHVECPVPKPGKETPGISAEMPERLCREWLSRLLETGTDALGVFETRPENATTAQLACFLDEIVHCTSFTFWAVKNSEDPNEKTGSEGVGDEKYVAANGRLHYRIKFVNEATASAPTAVVRINDSIDENLNLGSFQLEKICFADTVIEIKEEITYQKRIDLVTRDGVFVDILAGVNTSDGEAFWILRSIDPRTGEVPQGGALGFLRPDDIEGSGTGWVEFSLLPVRTAKSGIKIKNEAMVTFDANKPELTTPVVHTLDADPSESSVSPLPEIVDDPRIPLSWFGMDPAGGSGIASYTIYVSKDGGPFEPFLVNAAETTAVFAGEKGHRYAFYSCAADRAGNREDAPDPLNPDAWTLVRGGLFRRGDVDGDGKVNITDVIAFLGWNFRGDPATLVCPDSADADDTGDLTVTDAIVMLGWQFRGDPPVLPPPGADGCGPDDEQDDLEECRYPGESCAP